MTKNDIEKAINALGVFAPENNKSGTSLGIIAQSLNNLDNNYNTIMECLKICKAFQELNNPATTQKKDI